MRRWFVVALVLIVSGCGGESSDKAGNVDRATTVLTLANSTSGSPDLQAFADEVAKRSDGAIRLAVVHGMRSGSTASTR